MDNDDHGQPVVPEPTISVTNEFTSIRVRRVFTRNGERLEVSSPRLGYAVRLDPLELESLTWQEPELFSGLLSTPYGPEDDVSDIRPLTELLASGPDAGPDPDTGPGSGPDPHADPGPDPHAGPGPATGGG